MLQTIATDLVSSIYNIDNLASILEIDENLNEYFNIYKEAPEIERRKEVLRDNMNDEEGDYNTDKYFM